MDWTPSPDPRLAGGAERTSEAYSVLSAISGSTRAARRAGIQAAVAATVVSAPMAIVATTASVDLVLEVEDVPVIGRNELSTSDRQRSRVVTAHEKCPVMKDIGRDSEMNER